MRNLYTLKAQPTVTFYTVDGVYPLVPRGQSNEVLGGSHTAFNDGLVAFNTQNDSSTDLPTATIVLTDDYDWSSLLAVNDYVRIDMAYRGNLPYSDKGTTVNTCLYCGLIADIKRNGSYSDNGANRSYSITVQGMAKVLKNMQLSTFSELTSNLSSYQLLPDDEKTGIAFSGKSSADIITEVLKRFILNDNQYTDYTYMAENGNSFTLSSLIVTNIESNADEAFANQSYNQYSNYNGTILKMIQDLAARPFNEMFWTNENGVATLVYRPTPFDPERWNALERIELNADNVIADPTSVNDSEQCSIFKLLAKDGLGSTTYSGGWSGSVYPLTNILLIQRYGYTTMEVAVDYFNGTESTSTDSNTSDAPSTEGTSESEAALHYPPYESIDNYLAYARGNKTNSTLSIPGQYGGVSQYNKISGLLSKKPSQSSFVSSATALSSSITSNMANEIYASAKQKKYKISRSSYLAFIAPNYTPTSSNVSASATYLKSLSKMKEHPKKSAEELMQMSNYTLGSKQAYDIIEYALANKGKVTEAQYKQALAEGYNATEDGVSAYGKTDSGVNNSVPYMFRKYSIKLFNWYADNSKFHSGTITIQGTVGVENGKRLVIYDDKEQVYWEYYIESVSHNFSFTSGWTTDVGVTRGLPLSGLDDTKHRFSNPYSFWGEYTDFKGGYFGEQDLATAISNAESSSGSSDSGNGGSAGSKGDDHFDNGGSTATKAVKAAISLESKAGAGSYSQAYHSQDPFSMSSPKGDCSSLVYFAYKKAGKNLSGNGGWTTWDLAKSNDLKTIGSHGDNKDEVYKKIHVGDLIYWDTDGVDGHVGLATSKGCIAWNVTKGVEEFSLKSSSYWWNAWHGHCMRLKG